MKAGPSSMEYHATRIARGFTLIEQVVAAAILTIAALGALHYEYFAAGQARIARVQTDAARAAQLLIEDWKSTGGSDEYDPASLGLGFANAGQAPGDFATADGMGSALNGSIYSITLCDMPVLILLAYRDVDQDTVANIVLRQLAVIVRYGQSRSGGITVPEPRFADLPAMTFVTYVRRDATDG
ncbi:MAG TPA: prepilin-type N-terminal cleavage/methylation domain-containing protein [Sedimentisphaerales bacterium]|nr:prepilin-type N-terminal cleavage/methylation domain-containing protein [Sedimentisphaerales bacterium]